MDARFKDNQAEIKAIKAHLLQTTGIAPPTIFFLDKPSPVDAKKREKMQELKKKGYDDGLYIAPDNSSMLATIPRPDGSKKGTSTPKDIESPKPKRRPPRKPRQPKTTPSRSTKHTPKPPKSSPHQTSKPTVVETPVVSTAVDTSVVSADVNQTTATSTHTTQTPALTKSTTITSTTSPPTQTAPAKKQKTSTDTLVVIMTTMVETPVVSTAVSQPPATQISAIPITTTDPTNPSPASPKPKRRRIILQDDDPSPPPPPTTSQPLTLVTIPNPEPLSSVKAPDSNKAITPACVQYPLDIPAVREEIKSFYAEDDPAKRNFPSLQGYPRPNNIEEYLKLKAQQAEDMSKRNTEGKSDKEIQRNYQYLLIQVRTLEEFSKDLCQKLSERGDETLRKDYLDHIMEYKKYKGEKYMYKEWSVKELEEELERIHKMNKDKVKHTPPVWAKYKKNVPE
ncbi:hypothetical protein Hanom_Chr07g00621791 [Helianthus anomalus]